MRRNLLILIAVFTLFVFTAFAMAQTPGGTTGVSQGSGSNSSSSNASSSPNPQNSSQPVTGAATDPYSVKSGANGRAADSGPASSASEKTLDGCIVKEQTDYFIQPASGDREKLTGTDVSSHVGHHVTLHGTETASAASSNSSDRSSTSGTGSAETQNNAAGSMAGNSGSSNATGTASNSSNPSGKDFNVTKVDMVSESCPADIQSKIDQNKSH